MPKAQKPYFEFGRKIARLRLDQSFTQEAAAEAVGISLQYYQALEQGERMAAYATLVRIKKAFKASSWDLILP